MLIVALNFAVSWAILFRVGALIIVVRKWFEARASSPTSVEFTNAAHDYPQRIRYELKDGRLHAEISLLDGTKAVQWSYSRENP